MQLPLLSEESGYPFLVAPVAILESPDLGLSEKMVALVLCSLADKHGRCLASHDDIGRRASLTRRTVTRVLDSLIDKGVICADGGGFYLAFMDVFARHIPQPPHKRQFVQPERSVSDEDIREIFAYWCKKLRHPKAHLTKVRREKIARRLQEGLSVRDAKRVIDLCAASPFHTGKNDNATRYDTLERHIFVSREKVEWWLSQTRPEHDPEHGREARITRALDALDGGWMGEDEARHLVKADEWTEVMKRRSEQRELPTG